MILTVTMNPAIDKIYMIDNYMLGEVHRPTEMIASPGGKGLNVARVSKLMGENVGATGPLGGGNGAYVEAGIKNLGIKAHFCPIEGETRICINVTDRISQLCTEILEEGPVLSQVDINNQLTLFERLMDEADIVTISGSLAKGLPTNFYGELIKIARKKGKKTLLDSSGDAFIQGVKAKPYAIKPNEDEIARVYNGPVLTMKDKIKVIDFFKNQGIELPIISMGKDGSLAGLNDGIYKISIPAIKVVNTVGSGDSFIAGLAVGLRRGLEEIDLLKLATACGTANTQYSQTGFIEIEKVDEFYKKIQVVKIADYIKMEE